MYFAERNKDLQIIEYRGAPVPNKKYKKHLFVQVVLMAPNHYTARLKLSVIMRTLGRPEDALLALDQDETEEMLNPHLLLQRCQLLIEENKIQEFLVKSKLLFSRHFVNIRNKEELHAVSSAKKISSKNRALNEVRSFRREPLDESEAPGFEETQEAVTVQEEFALFMKVCDILFEEEKYEELQRLAFSALGSPTFARNIKIHKECEFLCLLSKFYNIFHRNINPYIFVMRIYKAYK